MDAARRKDLWRLVVAVAILFAGPLYICCGALHVCMAGHMQHAPYTWWHYLLDGAWTLGFLLACVGCWQANLHLRKMIFLLLMLLFASRLILGSGGGFLFVVELPLLLLLIALAIRNLFGGAPDFKMVSDEQRLARRRKIVRGWCAVGIAILGMGLLIWAIPHGYRLIKTMTAQKLNLTSIPVSHEIRLARNDACLLRLPNQKTVALWCSPAPRFVPFLENANLVLHYGEVPFKPLEYEEIPLPDGGFTLGEYRSYIKHGSVSVFEKTHEYILFVDNYRLSLTSHDEDAKQTALNITVSIRLASKYELDTR